MMPHRAALAVAVAIAGGLFTPQLYGQATRPDASQPAVTLHAGDPAPAISVAGWAKGTPVTAFEPGRVYVLEFWATWCGPCKQAMPHLTELARQYAGRVSFIGVDVYELNAEDPDKAKNDTDLTLRAKVDKTLVAMGDKVGYPIALDGMAGRMAVTWMKAAGQDSIPATFVVDGHGRIAWIGSPDGLEKVLGPVLAGTLDLAAQRRQAQAAAAVEASRDAAYQRMSVPTKAHDWAGVLKACDAVAAQTPPAAGPSLVAYFRTNALLKSDPAALGPYLRSIVAAGKPDPVATAVRVLVRMKTDHPPSTLQWKEFAAIVDPVIAPGTLPEGELYGNYSELLHNAGDEKASRFYLKKAIVMTTAQQAAASNIDIADSYGLMAKRFQSRLAKLQGADGKVKAE